MAHGIVYRLDLHSINGKPVRLFAVAVDRSKRSWGRAMEAQCNPQPGKDATYIPRVDGVAPKAPALTSNFEQYVYVSSPLNVSGEPGLIGLYAV